MAIRRKTSWYVLMVLPLLSGGALLLGPLADQSAAAPAKGSPAAHSAANSHRESGTRGAAGTHGAAADHSSGTAGTSGDSTTPQPASNADQNSGGANGDCPGGPYCSTRDGSPSGNGNGNGNAVGKPCAGCVGKADNKNPRGQFPNGTDANAGYECDRNDGIGRTNPAHTGCASASTGGSDCTTNPSPQCSPGGPACVPAPANHFCSSVLGTKQTRKPTTSVLGTVFRRFPSALPFTGLRVALLVTDAGLCLAAGAVLLGVVAYRRRRA